MKINSLVCLASLAPTVVAS